MHIVMIYGENRPFPPDIRVEKEVNALCKGGHKVTVLTRHIPPDALSRESLIDGRAEIKRIPISENSFISRQLWHFTLVQKNWLNALIDFIEKGNPDALHVHDFDLVLTTLKVARKYDLPVVADLHENMPAAHRAYRSNKPFYHRFTNGLLFNYHFWRYMESRSLKNCAKIIVVVPEAAVRLYQYGIPTQKIVVVSNTEDETTFTLPSEIEDNSSRSKISEKWIVLYVGGIGPHRGIDTVIQSLPRVVKKIPNIQLKIVGARNNERDNILNMAQRNNVSPFLDVIEWLPFEKIKTHIITSDVCLVPHNNYEHTQTTVPHKLFQYMLCQKPVLVSNCRPLARIIHETKAGQIFIANDSCDFAKKLEQMYNNPEELKTMGLNGKQAALSTYAWRNDADRLIHMYQELDN